MGHWKEPVVSCLHNKMGALVNWNVLLDLNREATQISHISILQSCRWKYKTLAIQIFFKKNLFATI